MPTHLKERVRARMEKTGESYQQALRHVRAQEERVGSGPSTSPAEDEVSRSRTVADTAFSIALVRAEEGERPEAEQLFADPYASVFVAAGAHAAEATQRFVELPFFRDAVRLRTRFLDDCVRDALAAGHNQVVLLGAGFDARGLRMRVAGFRRGVGAMFVWEGVIGYIDDGVIDQCLRFMAGAGGQGSRVAFTFADEAFLGEEPMAARTKRCGFASYEALSSDDLWRRYLPGEPHPNAWLTKVGLATV